MSGNTKDFKVKAGIQPTSYFEGVGTVVSGSVGYNLSSASYDSVSFSVASEDTVPLGIAFNTNGTKMYMIGDTNDNVYQYTLSTAFDLSTASYDSVSFSVATQDASAIGIAFNNDGTKMYMLGSANDSLYQYSLSTAFDVSTASYDSVSFSVASQDTSPRDISFNSAGTKMYIVGSSLSVHQYTLSTTFDLSTASYDSVSFSVASQDTNPSSVAFNSDGTKMYVSGNTNDSVYQYSLSTAFDVSTASYDSVSFSVTGQDTTPYDIAFNSDGTKLYVVGLGTDTIYQYTTALNTAELDLSTGSVFEVTPTSDIQVTLSNPADSGTVSGATLLLSVNNITLWDISTAVYSQSFSVATQEITPAGLFFKPDGTKMYVVGFTGDDVNEYDLSTAWDVSTAVYSQSFSVATEETGPVGLFFKPDGTKMYVIGQTGDDVNEYDLSTAWDVSTASYLQNFSVSAQDSKPFGLFFKPDGTKMYVVGEAGDDVNEYDLSTAWDVSTATFLQNFSVSAQETIPTGLFFKPDGTKMYVAGTVGDNVYEYDLSTAWDVSTAVYSQSFSVATEETGPYGLFFKPDGTKMYVVGEIGDDVNEYDLGSAITITYGTAVKWPSGTAPASPAVGETDVITFNTRDGGTTYSGVLAIDGAS